MRNIPLGTAYTIWTGIGAVGAFVVGMAGQLRAGSCIAPACIPDVASPDILLLSRAVVLAGPADVERMQQPMGYRRQQNAGYNNKKQAGVEAVKTQKNLTGYALWLGQVAKAEQQKTGMHEGDTPRMPLKMPVTQHADQQRYGHQQQHHQKMLQDAPEEGFATD